MKNTINIGLWVKVPVIIACLLCVTCVSRAQEKEVKMSTGAEPPKKEATPPPPPEPKLVKAQRFASEKKYDSSILLYNELYKVNPDDIYREYLNTLVIAKKFKDAEKMVQARIGSPNLTSIYEIDLGKIYKLQGKDAKAKEWFDTVIRKVNGDDNLTQRLAKAFVDAEQTGYAIKVYERACQIYNNPYFYCVQMSAIYAKAGDQDKAMDMLLAPPVGQYISLDQVKTTFLEWMGNDPKRLQIAQKNLLRHINAQPENPWFAEILTWIYTQKNDWDGALMQIEAVDERNKEDGRRLIVFGRTANAAKQYETAIKAYDEVIAKGAATPNSVLARYEKLNTEFDQLQNTSNPKPEEITRIMGDYDSMLTNYPLYYATQVAANYATVAAQYADSVDKAIRILQKAIKYPDTKRDVAGKLKLQLGDCYVLKGKIWDASLTYSQVDKEFKQDVLGENARFSNAKLAYYRGDFDWAQHMLGALKASTTELIANDALYLSVLITENIEDSNTYPLTRFAYAGLLRSQNKDAQANTLLDSIATAFPKHPLNDDILMAHAEIARKHKEFDKAISYLTAIVEKYGEDVLGDDALFMMAEIYRTDLQKNDLAKKYYEKLIIDFPGSTFIQIARQKLREINEGTAQ
jgi:predicted Zn-dependent protease